VLIARLVFILLVFAEIESADDLDLLMGINGLSQVIAALLAFAILMQHGYRIVWPSLNDCRSVLKSASPFFLSRVAVSTYTAGGALFLGMVSNTTSVALYAVAEQLYRGAQALLSPLSQVMYPYMMRTQNFHVLIKATAIATLVACAGSALTILMGEEIIRLLFGTGYQASLPVMQIFFITIIINTPSVLFGYPMLGALGKIHLANRSVIIGGVLQLAILWSLYLQGQTSAVDVALAVMIVELFVLIIRFYWSGKQYLKERRHCP
jgi:PST family polysaccharide transporter